MLDATEAVRREMLAVINAQPGSREALEAEHGQVWNTQELGQDFEVLGFACTAGRRPTSLGRCERLAVLSAFAPVLFSI